ncbi:MAG TPA: RIP metalloprotease RseP, partial [Vicinamibacterales bacterium]|nr:RIP metalloprotease RseP [Vicinamibacterales bacterium]
MTSTLAFLFVLGVLIFVHELGHFLMARRIGVRVLTFSLGFGPKLVNVKRGDTEYCISAIPLGGYVKMAGENPEDARTGASDEFLSKGKWQRFQVLVMGPVMNLLLSLVVMTVVLYHGAEVAAFEQQPVVIGSFAEKSVGARSGLKIGDRVDTLDGKPVDTWDHFFLMIAGKAKREVGLGVVRDGKALQITVVPEGQGKYELGDIGIGPMLHPEIADTNPGDPAAQAGLRGGDVILALNSEQNVSYTYLLDAIRSHEGKPLTLTVKRGDTIQPIVVTPRDVGGQVMIGAHIHPGEIRTVDPGPLEAVKLSVQKNVEWTT